MRDHPLYGTPLPPPGRAMGYMSREDDTRSQRASPPCVRHTALTLGRDIVDILQYPRQISHAIAIVQREIYIITIILN